MDSTRNSLVRLQGIQLGDAVNLLHGVDGLPIAAGSPLVPAPRAPLRRIPVEIDRSTGTGWRPLSVTIHSEVGSLYDRLFACHVEPLLSDGPGFDIRPALLVRGETERAQQQRRLEELLGVELVGGRSYLLLELGRFDGRADHEVTARPTRRFFDRRVHLTPEWRRASTRLRPGQRIHDENQHDARITAAQAARYVDAFYEYGTHFVSAVTGGDVLVQAIALRPEVSAEVSRYWHQIGDGRPVVGDEALAFGPFLGPVHALQAGPIVSLAQDPELEASVDRGVWSDAGSSGGGSLLAAFRSGHEVARAALEGFQVTAPIGIELTSLARFMEFYRAINFERVLRGALLQRWGDRVHLALRRLPSVERSIAATVLHSDDSALPFGDRLNLSDAQTLDSQVGRSAGCFRVLQLRGCRSYQACDLPAPMLAQLLDAERMSPQAPVLRLGEMAFAQHGVVCQSMAGVLILEDESGSRRDAVVDGLRFADAEPAPDTARPRVRVRGDLHALDAQELAAALPSMRGALESVSAALSFGGAPGKAGGVDQATDGEQRRADAASYAEWLASLLPRHSDDPAIQGLRVRALYLARIEGGLPVRGDLHEAAIAPMIAPLSGIASLAIEADERLRDYDAQLWARSQSVLAAVPSVADEILSDLCELNRRSSDLCLALLHQVRATYPAALGQAVRAQRDAVFALDRAASGLRTALAGRALGPAGQLVLHTLTSASCSYRRLADLEENLLNHRTQEAAGIALEFAGREARLHARSAQLDALQELCDALADDPAALDVAERGLAGLDPTTLARREGDEPLPLRAAISDGLQAGPELERSLDGLLVAWDQFKAARRNLFAVRGASYRTRMAIWSHAFFEHGPRPGVAGRSAQAVDGLAGSVRQQVQLERFRLLTTLSHALACQRAALRGAGQSPSAAPPGSHSPGALGLLMAMQNRLLPNPSLASGERPI
jgi:hypothetical protein